MEETLDDSDLLFVWLLSDVDRYDIVIVDKDDLDYLIIKRIVGVPGDTVQIIDGYLYINGELAEDDIYGKEVINDAGIAEDPVVLGDGQYFVLGDNRNNSADSRYIGLIGEDEIMGVVKFRFYPNWTFF